MLTYICVTLICFCLSRYYRYLSTVEVSWNVMAHAQKPDFVLSAKRTSPFKSAGASFQSTTGSRGVRISGSNAGYTMFRGSVKGTGYPLHSPVSPSVRHRVTSHLNWSLQINSFKRSPSHAATDRPPFRFTVQVSSWCAFGWSRNPISAAVDG